MPPTRYAGPPMTLGNMRANGVRTLAVSCALCRHSAVLQVDAYPADTTVPSFGPRLACTACGAIGADVRPNWAERAERASLTGEHWKR